MKRHVKVSTRSRPAALALHCPACRTLRRCVSAGTATIAGKRREVVRCTAADCGLQWVPERSHLPDTPAGDPHIAA